MYSQALISPIRRMAVFEAQDIEPSFRYLQKGDPIGKAVVKIPSNASEIPSTSLASPFALNVDASYLLTGGLGGLGRSIACWMVEKGARHLVFLSRSAGKGEADQSFFAELRSMGCSVTDVAGKAEDMEDINRAIRKVSKPIRGIVHLAMVLRVGIVLIQLD